MASATSVLGESREGSFGRIRHIPPHGEPTLPTRFAFLDASERGSLNGRLTASEPNPVFDGKTDSHLDGTMILSLTGPFALQTRGARHQSR